MLVGDIKNICVARLDREIKNTEVFYTLCYSAMLRICLFCSPKHLISNLPGDTQRIETIGTLRYPIQPTTDDEHIDIDDALCLAVVSFVCSDLSTVRELKNYFLDDGMSIVSNYESIRLRESNAIAKKEAKGGRGVY